MLDNGPVAGGDRGDASGIREDAVPGIASGGRDRLAAVKAAVGEFVVAEKLPDIRGRVRFGRFGRQRQQGEAFWEMPIAVACQPA